MAGLTKEQIKERTRLRNLKHDRHAHVIDCGNTFRIWMSWNPEDVFDVINVEDQPEARNFLLSLPTRLPEVFVADFPEGDAGDLECVRCRRNRGEPID